MEGVYLSVRNLCKSFSTPVLKDINLSIARGEVRGIVGENGAGKSTLVNILAGILPKDAGELFLDGIAYEPRNPAEGFAAGVSCAAQELSTISTLSVAENIGLRNLPQQRTVIRTDLLKQKASKILQRVGLDNVSPDDLAESLTLPQRQLLELAKALAADSQLLILDEPTAALTAPQASHLHSVIADLAADGTAVIYVSHRLDDVLSLSDSVTVLRDGKIVASGPADTFSVTDIVRQMAGRNSCAEVKSPGPVVNATPLLQLADITTGSLPHPINLSCYEGEIVGIAGLAGAGRSELLEAAFGLTPLTGGHVYRCIGENRESIKNAQHAVAVGMGFLGEDRQSMGIYRGQSVLTNMMLPGKHSTSYLFKVINEKTEADVGNRFAQELSIKMLDLSQDIAQLSGGNQQKALLARWLHCDSDILLLDEPTRGVDVGTKDVIYEILFEMQKKKKAVIVASSELQELMLICSRIFVLSDRMPIRMFERGEWSEAEILKAAFHAFTNNTSADSGDISHHRKTMVNHSL